MSQCVVFKPVSDFSDNRIMMNGLVCTKFVIKMFYFWLHLLTNLSRILHASFIIVVGEKVSSTFFGNLEIKVAVFFNNIFQLKIVGERAHF